MENLKYLFGPMRIPFLLLTPACSLLGLGTAIWSSDHVSAIHFILAFAGALCAHISVNAFNEFFDFRSGLDFKTTRTPFSGGSGTLPEKPEMQHHTLYTALISFAITTLIGLYFIYKIGLPLLPLGVIGLIVVIVYTPWLTRNAFLCLIAPGLGFGPLMVMGTHFVLAGKYTWTAFIASLIPFFLVNNLLLLNQFPDVEADKNTGRRHFPVIIGRRSSSLIYGAFILLAYLSIILGVNYGYLPRECFIGLLGFVIAVPVFIGAYRYADDLKRLMPYMGFNVLINIGTPVLVAIGLLIA
jgi:1,4-dihydroxy-2-naphthoate octaprenyltransferase